MNVWPLTAFLIVLMILLRDSHEWPVIIVFVFLSVTGILFCLKLQGRSMGIRTISMPILTAGVFLTLLTLRTDLDRPMMEDMPPFLTGTVHETPVPTVTGNSLRFVMKSEEAGKVQVYVRDQNTDFRDIQAGMTCRVTEPDLVVPDSPGNPHGFDYSLFLKRDKIFFQTFIDEKQLQCLPDLAWGYYTFIRLRAKGMDRVNEELGASSPKTAALIHALVYGDRSSVDASVIEAYQRLGIIHLLAVSGLHVGLLTLAMNSLLLRLGVTRERSLWVLLAMLPIYMILAGGAPSVMRASLTVAAVILAVKSGRKMRAVDGVSLVFIGLLVVNPNYLYHAGFQLSFLTSFALIMSSPLLGVGNRLAQLMKVTLAAQIIAAPVMISLFFEWSLFAVFMNLLMVPAVTMVLLPGAFLGVFGLWVWPSMTTVFSAGAEVLLTIMDSLLVLISESSYATLLFGRPDPWMLLVLCAGSCVFFLIWERGGRHGFSKGLTVFLAVMSIVYVQPYFDRAATVTFLDVGQGDAAVIELPHKRAVYMIDTGGVPSWQSNHAGGLYDYEIEPFLRGQGISRLDLLILTHGHEDHVGEVCRLSERMPVKRAVFGGASNQEQVMIDSLACLSETGAGVSRGVSEMAWDDGKSAFRVLHPGADKSLSENDLSLVLDAKISGVDFLFTGDIEAEAELLLKDVIRPVTILKVAHHGSNTSSGEGFLLKAKPSVSIISAGQENRYGHPHEDVIERLSEHGSVIFSTAESGAVQIRAKNGVWSVSTHKK